MDKERIIEAFASIGARATVQPMAWPDFADAARPVEVRVVQDGAGATFDVRVHPHAAVTRVGTAVDAAGTEVVLTLETLGDAHRFACGRAEDGWYARGLEPVEVVVGAAVA